MKIKMHAIIFVFSNREMLKLGSSVKWPEQLEMLTGTSQMSAQPLIDYFKPLIKFLDEETSNENVGWTTTGILFNLWFLFTIQSNHY
jgi:hypothetical protein